MTSTRSAASRGPADSVRCRPDRLVLGLGESPLAAGVASHFRSLGWDVTLANSGVEAGWVAHRARPTAVVMAADLPGETGYLTCAKVRLTRPACRVVLVGPETDRAARRARYAGAVGYLPDTAEVAAVARAVLGT